MLHHNTEPPRCQVKIIRPYTDFVPKYFWNHPCDSQNVKEALAPEVEYWSPDIPILITAGTGMGKTTFVYEVLIPRILASGKNLLLISNRVALSAQQKDGVMKILDHPFQGKLPPDVLREWSDFGQVSVITYHQLPSFMKDETKQSWLANLQYVVADEIHFLAADSSFNTRCDQYLRILTTKFMHATRIYLTATEWDILSPLADAEEAMLPTRSEVYKSIAFGEPVLRREFLRYVFKPDYSYVNLNFFDDWKEIYQMVKNTPEEKWLIFVDSKQKGAEVKRNIGDCASYIDADSKETEEWAELLTHEKFEKRVLVTTAVLDCGVNINDDSLRNIVIVADNRTSLIQMLGRKRRNRKKPNQKLNLYVQKLGAQKLANRLNKAYEINSLAEQYEASLTGNRAAGRHFRGQMSAKLWEEVDSVLRRFFVVWEDGDLHMGKVAIHTLRRRIRFWEALVNPEVDFTRAVYEWLGKADEFKTALEKLVDFCRERKDESLCDEDMLSLRRLAAEAELESSTTRVRQERVDTYGPTKLNHIFTALNLPCRMANKNTLISLTEEE